MPPAAQEQFPGLYSGSLPDGSVRQLLVEYLPRVNENSSPLPITLVEACPPIENLVTNVVPEGLDPVLVKWSPLELFEQRAASLTVTREIRFARAIWDLVIEETNHQDTATTNTSQVTVGLTIERGEEASETVKERPSFVGLNLKYGESNHVFTEEETQKPHQVDIHYVVPARTKVYGYQRRFLFGYNLWFAVNTNGLLVPVPAGHTVGPDISPVLVTIETTIRSEQTLFREVELVNGTIEVKVDAVDPEPGFGLALLDVKTIDGIVERIVQSVNPPTY